MAKSVDLVVDVQNLPEVKKRLAELEEGLKITGATLHHALRHEGDPRICKRYACESWLILVKFEENKD